MKRGFSQETDKSMSRGNSRLNTSVILLVGKDMKDAGYNVKRQMKQAPNDLGDNFRAAKGNSMNTKIIVIPFYFQF